MAKNNRLAKLAAIKRAAAKAQPDTEDQQDQGIDEGAEEMPGPMPMMPMKKRPMPMAGY